MTLNKLTSKFKAVFKCTPLLTVTFYMKSGDRISFYGATDLKTTKNAENRFSSYEITWALGFSPSLMTMCLDDVSAITATV